MQLELTVDQIHSLDSVFMMLYDELRKNNELKKIEEVAEIQSEFNGSVISAMIADLKE
ncbi:MAG: hypothetical protein ACI4M9_03955 [Succinivibrio sp.]